LDIQAHPAGLSTEKSFPSSVTDVNDAPTISVSDVQTAWEGVGNAISGTSAILATPVAVKR
jgi:hypothetical protein